jgi:CBS domain-containing protein
MINQQPKFVEEIMSKDVVTPDATRTGGLRVFDIMTKDVITLNRNDSLTTADDIMRLGRIRHLLVVHDDGELAGVLSQRDLFLGGLLRALGYGSHAKAQALSTMLAKDAMVASPFTTTPNTPLGDAAAVMLEHKIGCLPVIDKGKIVGIITESDFVAHLAARPR